MDGVLLQSQITAMNKVGNVVLDIESLTQQPDRCCSGSPKMTKALSRKGSNRMERRAVEEQETDDASKKIVVKVMPSQLEQLKQPLVPNKTLLSVASTANSPVLADLGEGRNKRFSRLTTIHPRKILLFFATMSSMGSMILIYYTLTINQRGGA
ncbi:uncharacterized protein LOC103723857 [Phoenix dactylifera]|uniref:Uncharacterized protein LOC103723857 n=1 Tax=Phoenix dactylifera TaxID=42345 RepID=A0A8B7D4Q8_PHODC|nr:uncharacterized protein LOC103723857 [Phoenix dactylifera]XP_008813167.1 uncharacterized protein LOC103723857 [Phoenix dactylifera]